MARCKGGAQCNSFWPTPPTYIHAAQKIPTQTLRSMLGGLGCPAGARTKQLCTVVQRSGCTRSRTAVPQQQPGKPNPQGGLGYSAHGVLSDAEVDEIPVAESPGQPAGDACTVRIRTVWLRSRPTQIDTYVRHLCVAAESISSKSIQ
jgi:hypothetical protein